VLVEKSLVFQRARKTWSNDVSLPPKLTTTIGRNIHPSNAKGGRNMSIRKTCPLK